jgi:hypothetical protein
LPVARCWRRKSWKAAECGNFGASAEPAVLPVDVGEQRFRRPARQGGIEVAVAAADTIGAREPGQDLLDRLDDLVRPLAVRPADRLEHPREAGPAVASDGREVNPPERFASREEIVTPAPGR